MIRVRFVLVYTVSLICLMFLFLLYILGAARYVTDFEENACEMTYMFEYPQYVRIAMDDNIEEKFPRFGLYAYGEGFVTEKLRRMHFTGIPVLFVPGNAGSHEQVRSLASVSLRKSLKDRTPFHFDFFTVSLGKDYSALYGGVLMEQTVYVSHCIKRILSLYKSGMENVVLIGHSMGGVVAKGALLLVPDMNITHASIIINLATPHTPSLVLDNTFANYYYNLESKVSELREAGVTVVSIGGGPRDVLVTGAQAVDPTANINVLSTSIPDVWQSVDHLSILWCKQLVLSIVRSLFDSVDFSKRPARISHVPHNKMQAMAYHFSHRAAGKRLYHYTEKVQFPSGGEWIENIQRRYTWDSKKDLPVRTPCVYLMIRLADQPDSLSIETVNLKAKDWLFICSASTIQGFSRVCDWGWNLTNKTRMTADHLHRLRKSVDLNLRELNYSGMTHILVRIPDDDFEDHVTVHVDLYSHEDRVVPAGSKISLFSTMFGISKTNLLKFEHGSLRYYVPLGNNQNVVSMELKNTECTDANTLKYALVELLEPWNPGAMQLRFFTDIDNGPKTLRLQTKSNNQNSTPILRISLNPMCSYTFSINAGGIIDQISCTVRDCWPTLYMILISLLLLLVSIRIDHGNEKVPTIVVTLVLSYVFGIIFETCVAIAILCIFAFGTCCSVVFLGSVAHSIAVRFLARAIAFSTTWADWLLGGLHQLPIVTTILVMSIIPATCGALAMVISVFLFFLKLTQMYEDYLEELLLASLQHFNWIGRLRSRGNNDNEGENTRENILNNLIIFMLWCFVAIAAGPSVLVWAKHFRYDTRLSTEDPILLSSWLVLVPCGILGLARISSKNLGRRSQILANILRGVTWIALSTTATTRASFYQWCIPPMVAVLIGLMAINAIIPEGSLQ